MEIEFLMAGGSGKTQSLDLVPVVVSLDLTDKDKYKDKDKYYGNKELELVVSRISAEGEKIKELFKSKVLDWQ